jgi:hypothetical protein
MFNLQHVAAMLVEQRVRDIAQCVPPTEGHTLHRNGHVSTNSLEVCEDDGSAIGGVGSGWDCIAHLDLAADYKRAVHWQRALSQIASPYQDLGRTSDGLVREFQRIADEALRLPR